ncbi:hypothetical protein [Streptomyces platensis]|uniref:hypothetical protein n=1 Tax=Streptomyces platensis TaxID=58346 RepID=UPI0037A36C6A
MSTTTFSGAVGALGDLAKITTTPQHLSVITGDFPARAPATGPWARAPASPHLGSRPDADKRQGPRPEVGGLDVG